MNEVKNPRKPLIVFYIIMLLVMFAFNSLIAPMLTEEQKIKEVDYGTFMTMTEEGNIGSVQIEENQILFTSKDGKEVYRTGVMNDPDLVNRLHASGAEFTTKIIQKMSPLASFFLSWILPIFIFIALGQFLSRKMMDKAGGPGSMIFNMGKSNARVYVKSSDGIKFDDVVAFVDRCAKQRRKEL